MFILANCLGGPSHLGVWIEQMFRESIESLHAVAGWEAFYLRTLLQEEGLTSPTCLYVSLTVWRDRSCFDAWRTGAGFARSHAQLRTHQALFDQITLRKRFDFAGSSLPVRAEQDQWLLTRLSIIFPNLIPVPYRVHLEEVMSDVITEGAREQGTGETHVIVKPYQMAS